MEATEIIPEPDYFSAVLQSVDRGGHPSRTPPSRRPALMNNFARRWHGTSKVRLREASPTTHSRKEHNFPARSTGIAVALPDRAGSTVLTEGLHQQRLALVVAGFRQRRVAR